MIFESSDYEQNRLAAAFGYVIFFIPLLLCPNSKLGRFAANQGLLGFLATLAVIVAFWIVNLLLGWIPIVGVLFKAVGYLCRLAVLGVMIYGGVTCYRGEARPLPYIGQYEFFR